MRHPVSHFSFVGEGLAPPVYFFKLLTNASILLKASFYASFVQREVSALADGGIGNPIVISSSS